MNFSQFIYILWFRKRIICWVSVITVITVFVVTLMLPKEYTANTSLVVDQHSVNSVTGTSLPLQLLTGYLATQVDIIGSHNVARKVVEKLKLTDDPETQKNFAKDKEKSDAPIDIIDWKANLLIKKLDITPSHDSSVIQIEFKSGNPESAAKIANAFATAYIQTSIELRAQAAKLIADWFEKQMVLLRERLEHAQLVLSSYQQKYGIVTIKDRIDLENAHLTDLSGQLMNSMARTNELQSRKDFLATTIKQGAALESFQEVLKSTTIGLLKSELATAEANFVKLSKWADINHPQYQQLKAEVNSLQQKIKSEIQLELNSIDSNLSSSQQLDKIIATALAEQKAKVLELKKQNDEIAVFQREVENAQRAYDAAMQRGVETRMESEMSQTDISILNPAIPPTKASNPKMRLNMILSIFLGGILGAGSAILVELLDRRVRSAIDILEVLDLPVFALISAQPSKTKRILWPFYSNMTSRNI
jgi:polysaccharide biosynthesis transport protein